MYFFKIDPQNEKSTVACRYDTKIKRGYDIVFDQKDPQRFAIKGVMEEKDFNIFNLDSAWSLFVGRFSVRLVK